MADVFISFARSDEDRVKPIAERLSSLGYAVSMASDAAVRQAELEEARAVLVAWSQSARASTHVIAEASAAHDARKLLQLRMDAAAPPAPFNRQHTADMSGGGEWGLLENALAQLVRNGAPAEAPKMPTPGPLATPSSAGAPKTLLFAITATLAAYVGAVSAAYNELMRLEQLEIALVGMMGVAAVCAALTAHRLMLTARTGD